VLCRDVPVAKHRALVNLELSLPDVGDVGEEMRMNRKVVRDEVEDSDTENKEYFDANIQG
jgi:hypothetical protein